MNTIKLLLLLVIFTFASLSASNPIIAIYANPYSPDAEDQANDDVFSTYVKWLENAGAEVLVIHSWYDRGIIDEILTKVNGVLFQGGMRNLDLAREWEKNAAYILDKAKEINDKGIYFPLWGTCQGFQLFHMRVAKDTNVLSNFNAFNVDLPAILTKETKEARMFKSFNEDLEYFSNSRVNPHFNNLGVSPDVYDKNENLKNFFKITSLAKDKSEKVFVNSVEAYSYPFYSVQFHPEKIINDTNEGHNIPTRDEAIRISQHFSAFFINEARKNSNTLPPIERARFTIIDDNIKRKEIVDDEFAKYSFKRPNLIRPNIRVKRVIQI